MSERWSLLHLRRGDLQLTLLPGIGGRLWDVEFEGQSLLFQNPDLTGLPIDELKSDFPTRSPQFGFPLWGGEKTWIAPDTSWMNGAPFAALDSGPYRVASNSKTQIELTSDVCPTSHLSVTRRIDLISENSWTIDHAVTNHGPSPRATGIWSVMMINTPARIGVPMNEPAYYRVFGDEGALVNKHPNCVLAQCSTQQEFKVGVPNPQGDTLIKFGNGGPLMLCEVPRPSQGDRYAHQFPFEIFNSGDYDYCEAEWHSVMVNLVPKETHKFQQSFSIWPNGDPRTAPDRILSSEELLSCMS